MKNSERVRRFKAKTVNKEDNRFFTAQELPYDIRVQLYPREGDVCEVKYPDKNYKGRTMELPRKWRKEMIRFANSPQGTGVWCMRFGEKRWIKMYTPSWIEQNMYIVDDEDAEKRKAEHDEKEKKCVE
jgi:hypothetical protein